MLNIENIKNFFNSNAQNWDDKNADSLGAKKITEQFIDNIKFKDILDIGCGTGVMYPHLLKAQANSYTGIDISEEMIKHAKEKFSEANFICANILDWNTEQKFDTIIMYNVYPHLDNKEILVKKVYSMLNDNGYFIVAHGSSRHNINAHHNAHALQVSQKLLKANEEAEIWREKFDVKIIRDDELYFFSGKK